MFRFCPGSLESRVIIQKGSSQRTWGGNKTPKENIF